MSGWLAAAVAAATLYLLVRALVLEPGQLVVERVAVTIPGLPPQLDGLEMVQVSDLHLRGRVGEREHRLVQWVRSQPAPVLVLTGDFVQEDAAVANLVPLLMEMTQGKQAFAVLGNHDVQPPGRLKRLLPVLEGAGIKVLNNVAVTLTAQPDDRQAVAKAPAAGASAGPGFAHRESWGSPKAGPQRLWLVGLDDPHSGRADVEQAFAPVAAGEPVVVLAHSPDAAPAVAQRGAHLLLCGHTHGGQVNLPGIGPLWTASRVGRRLGRGLGRLGQTWVYVNRGYGCSLLPLRLFCPPEVTVIRLRRAEEGET